MRGPAIRTTIEFTRPPMSRVTKVSAKRIMPAPSAANTRAKISMVYGLPRREAVFYAAQRRDRNRRGHRPVTAFLHEVNRMRTLPLLSLAALLAAPLAAQGKPSDPDVKAAGGGMLPAGWTSRLDDTTAKLADVKFVTMGPGLHFTSGPAGIYWRGADAVTGSFHTVATFSQTKAPMHPEAYGIFVAGKDLKGAGQSYVYFLVRGDGQYTIRQRQGATVTNITTGNRNGWSPNDALAKQDSATGKATNKLEVAGTAAGKKLKFSVNGKLVQEVDAPAGMVAGVVGIRMNHNLDVHVDGFAVHKM